MLSRVLPFGQMKASLFLPSQMIALVVKGTVSAGFKGFFMTYDIKSVLSAWALMVFNFFHLMVISIF
jgi:hypothetical protein